MEVAKVLVGSTSGGCLWRRRIPAGQAVGLKVSVDFSDPAWDAMTKTVVFRGTGSRIAEFDGKTAVIPWEVLEKPGTRIWFGIYGHNPETGMQLPLIEVNIGETERSTDPQADPGTDPTLPIWAQLQEQIEQLKQSGADEEKIAQVVENYLAKNPPTVEEKDPTVPDWAKQTEKPSYTADEVGALSKDALAGAVNDALTQAKESGIFDGAPGKDGQDGNDYVLTKADMAEIAELAADLVVIPDSGGNVDLTGVVKSVNGQTPDANGNVEIAVSGGTATAALPILYLVGDTTAMTKETRVDLRYTYVDSVKKEQRTGWCDCKWQGETSTAKPKKNYTIRFYNDPDHAKKDKIEYGGLTKASKWVTKANYVDQSHARNIVSARLWSDIVHSRSGELPTEMQESALNYGAIDGYPILIYLNGAYLGLYTMNIPKDEKLFGMDTDNPKHCALCGYSNNNGDNSVVLSTQFRTVNTNDWENEVPEEWNDTNRAALTNLVNFVKDSTDDEFVTNLNTYLDVESAIDYYIFMYFNGGIDSLGRNLVILTYDGVKWYCSGYDMDMTFGNNFNGTGVLSPTTACPEAYRENNSLLWQRLEALFGNAIYNRYTALRQTVLSTEYVNRAFEMFITQIPDSEYEADYKAWPNMGQAGVDHLAQITAWVEARAEYVDEQMLAFTEEIPCESVVLSAESLTFIAEDAQTLTANVTPANTSDRVVWSTSDEDVATVSKGIVTPVGNGSCVITATCGNFSDECAVTVNAFTEIVTGLPEGYTQLDYIVTAGSQTYFDTGVTVSNDIRMNAKLQPTNTELNWAYIAQNRDVSGASTSWRMYNGQYGHNFQHYLMGNLNSNTTFTPINGTDYVISTDETMSFSINDKKMFDVVAGENNTPETIILCGSRNAQGVIGTTGFPGRIYYMKFHKGTELVADYVPCINPDGIVGMYDLVTATFHGSEGTAQFTAPA